MKRKWKKPELEILELKMTNASTQNSNIIDATYVAEIHPHPLPWFS